MRRKPYSCTANSSNALATSGRTSGIGACRRLGAEALGSRVVIGRQPGPCCELWLPGSGRGCCLGKAFDELCTVDELKAVRNERGDIRIFLNPGGEISRCAHHAL